MDFHKMNFRIELYNTADDATKDFLSVIFSLIYLCFVGFWVFICLKNHAYVHRIHVLMGALIVIVMLDLILGPADSQCAKVTSTADGWDVVFYTFKFIRVVLFHTVIVLMSAGWSFLRPFLQVKEMIIMIIVILLNVTSILIRETNPYHIDRKSWGCWFFWVDNICLGSLLIPILGTFRWLDKACKVDVKAARSFKKMRQFTWLDEAPTLALVYISIWRYVVLCVTIIPGSDYSDKTRNLTEEIFCLMFCLVIFYMFRPVVENEYCFLDVQDEVEATHWAKGNTRQKDPATAQKRKRGKKNPGQVSFSYPKLPKDFEW